MQKEKDEFNRFYVCFRNLRDTWREYFRPIIGVDSTFLNRTLKGVLLTAIGHDANNQIYPIAWAVVQSETTDNWIWFIQQIKRDLVLEDGGRFVIISDRSKELKTAMERDLPKDMLKPMIWDTARSYTITEFEYNKRKLRAYDLELYNDVMKEQPNTWSRPFYKLGSYCEDADNKST